MKKLILALISLITLSFSSKTLAQEVKYGKVSKEELQEKSYPLDSSANAAVLYQKRRTHYEYSGNEGWILITKVHQRIKLYNKDGFDWATKKIRLYNGKNGDERISVKGNTYNIVDNKIEKTKLKKNGIFDEDISENWRRKKFTMPNIKAGTVVEWEYTVRSPYYSNIDDMVFQYEIPVKYVESKVVIPEYFKFKYQPNLYYPVSIKQTQKNRKLNFSYRENAKSISSYGSTGAKTVRREVSVDLLEKVFEASEKNIPALKEEPYVNNMNNYICKVSFELTAYTPKYGIPKFFNNTWKDVAKTIYKSSKFGGELKKTTYFKQDLATSLQNKTTLPQKVAAIFNLVKNKIKWNSNYGKYTNIGVKKAYKEGVGNAAEVNLTLVAMLREAGIKANPVLVSTRSHGVSLFPTTDGFNYVIAIIETPNGYITLDATEKYSIPNVLPVRTLNWTGRIVRKDGSSESVDLFPKRHAKENTYLSVKVDDDGLVSGSKRSTLTNTYALNYRNTKNNVASEELRSSYEKRYNIEIEEVKTSNKNDLGKPIVESYKFESEDLIDVVGDKLYVNPLLFLGETSNPFTLEDRKYPIDFATPWEEKLTVTIEIPEGYKVESIPEKYAISLPNNYALFKFLSSVKGNKIQVLSSIKMNTPIIPQDYYNAIKEFYKVIVEKHTEKIVLLKN